MIKLVYSDPEHLTDREFGEDYDRYGLVDYEHDGVRSIITEAKADGFEVSEKDAYCAWKAESDCLCASWLIGANFRSARHYLRRETPPSRNTKPSPGPGGARGGDHLTD